MYRAEDMRLPDSWGKMDPATTPAFIQRRIRENPLTPELLDPQKALQRIASYYGCLAQMDDCTGAVLRALKETGLEDDTIVVYTSDHGELLGEHSLWQKFVFYEASVGVPLIFRVPGFTAAGAVCETPVSHVQLAPTLAELCGVSLLASSDGESLVPLLKEPARAITSTVHAHYDMGTPNKKAMVRHGDWKYCHYENDIPELFNLREDPNEMRNLAAAPSSRATLDDFRSRIIGLEIPK
jgi:choline-sulfatase